LCNRAEFNAAEKDGKGMALKIFTEAKPYLKALFVVEVEMQI
jgi:hypothetical protein